jgi:hypothetical protein
VSEADATIAPISALHNLSTGDFRRISSAGGVEPEGNNESGLQ